MPTENSVPATEPPKRKRGFFRRWLRRLLFLVLGLLLVAFAYWHIDGWLTRRAGNVELQPLLVELDAADPDWRGPGLYEKRNARLAPPETNTAEQALAAAKLLGTPSFETELLLGLSAWRDLPLGQLPEEEYTDALRKLCDESRPALDAALRLRPQPNSGFRVSLPDHRSLLEWPPQAGHLNGLAKYLDGYAFLRATEQQSGEAFRSARAITTFADVLGDEPVLMAQLIRMGLTLRAVQVCERVIGLTEPDDADLAALVAAFQPNTPAGSLPLAIRGERNVFTRAVADLEAGRIDRDDIDIVAQIGGRNRDIGDRLVVAYLARYLPGEHAEVLKLYNRAVSAVSLPLGPERWKAFADIDTDHSAISRVWGNSAVRGLFIPTRNVVRGDYRTTALLRSTTAAIACERFRLKHGRFPKSLAELPKDLLPAIPEDPYTGQPLIFKATDTGIVIYAVGKDLKDNGGNFGKDDFGYDIGFTLLDPKHRRKPAPEKKPADVPPEE